MKWSSRWTIGVPLYELTQRSIYRDEAPTRSTPQQPIYWKHEFWGTKKHFNIKYFPMKTYNYNYKSCTLVLRQQIKNQGRSLEPIGSYTRYH